jgi:hypothetical protein
MRAAFAFHRFHRADNSSMPRDGGCPGPEPQKFDFHQRITLLLGYPYLLRLTGLVLELEFGSIKDFGGAGQPLKGTVGVRVNTGVAETDSLLNEPPDTARRPAGVTASTLTYYEIFEHRSRMFFLAADPEKGQVVKGILNLRKLSGAADAVSGRETPYFLETLDTDGAGWKALGLNSATGDGSEPQHALRTAGIMLPRGDRASKANYNASCRRSTSDFERHRPLPGIPCRRLDGPRPG